VSDDSAPIRAAIVGAGSIARQHLACLATLPEVEAVAVCDTSPAAAEAAAERFGVPGAFTSHVELLERADPDVVHVTTPPAAHLEVASDALEAGAHVIVEKPLATSSAEAAALIERARSAGRVLVEDYNYAFQSQTLAMLAMRGSELGELVHVDVDVALDVSGTAVASGGAGSAVRDFLPHLASLAHAFLGPHKRVAGVVSSPEVDELDALVEHRGATAALRFGALGRPDGLWLRVHGTRGRAAANLFEPRLTVERLRGGPGPLNPLVNQLSEAASAARAAVGGVVRKLGGGPGAYEGLWELLARTYRALAAGVEPPVAVDRVEEVNRLVAELDPGRVRA
jgi:predicted dehydrogenase